MSWSAQFCEKLCLWAWEPVRNVHTGVTISLRQRSFLSLMPGGVPALLFFHSLPITRHGPRALDLPFFSFYRAKRKSFSLQSILLVLLPFLPLRRHWVNVPVHLRLLDDHEVLHRLLLDTLFKYPWGHSTLREKALRITMERSCVK